MAAIFEDNDRSKFELAAKSYSDVDIAHLYDQITKDIDSLISEKRNLGHYDPSMLIRLRPSFETISGQKLPDNNDETDALLIIRSYANVNADPQTASGSWLATKAKRLIRKSMAWYILYLVDQFKNFTKMITELLVSLIARLNNLSSLFNSETIPNEKLVRYSGAIKAHELPIDLDTQLEIEISRAHGRILLASPTTCLLPFAERTNGALDLYLLIDDAEKDIEGLETSIYIRNQPLATHLASIADGSLSLLIIDSLLWRSHPKKIVGLIELISRKISNDGNVILLAIDLSEKNEFDIQVEQRYSYHPDTIVKLMNYYGLTQIDEPAKNSQNWTLSRFQKRDPLPQSSTI
ncbi:MULTISPECIES: hypothetical protein [Acidithrix]|uniref:Uncharacterized protein n=1 Tax=Acidithrix ferrooxidans TaxID=1280514 RepID=A0A0D8HI38_9ACTN|nr:MULTISPECIES: hypothetical protein [Acidithrix]KJF17588.1 hypothetical protein AXFE_15750 [Acidithrix ferrooxidans]CAG4927775.1 unnamed protein product [Acidithrix sp. C25]